MKSGAIISFNAGITLGLVAVAGKWGANVDVFNFEKVEIRFFALACLVVLCILYKATIGRSRSYHLVGWTSLMLMIGYFMLSLSWSNLEPNNLSKAVDLSVLAVILISLRVSKVQGSETFLKGFWFSVVLLATILSFFGSTEENELQRMQSFGGGAITFGRIMALAIFGCFCLFYRRSRYVFYLLALYFSTYIMLSGARGVMLATIIPLAWMLLSDIRLKAIFSLFLALALAAIYMPNIPIVGEALELFDRRVVDLTFGRGHDAGRSILYFDALEQWKLEPILGIGLGDYEWKWFTYPHNIFLEIASEGGTLGLLLFLTYFWNVRRAFFVNAMASDGERACALAMIFILISAQFSGGLYDSRLIFLLPIMCISVSALPESIHIKAKR